MLRKDRNTDSSTTASDNAHVTNLRIDLGTPTTVLVLGVLLALGGACYVVGLNTAERAHQEREARERDASLKRDWDNHTSALQREWSRQTAVLTEHMDDLARKYRMFELKLDDWSVVAHRHGLVLPGDYTRGPQGNLDSESFKQENDHGSRRDHPATGGDADGHRPGNR